VAIKPKTIWLSLGLALLCCAALPTKGAEQSATNAAEAGPHPISRAEVPTRAEADQTGLQTIEADLAADQTTRAVETELPSLVADASARLEETSRILASNPSLYTLRKQSSEWENFREELSGWKKSLTRRATQLEAEMDRLSREQKTWELTLSANQSSNTPPEVVERIQGVIAAVQKTFGEVQDLEARVLKLLDQTAAEDARVAQMLTSLERAREQVLSRLFAQDRPPIWTAAAWGRGEGVVQQSQFSFSRQVRVLRVYVHRKEERFLLHGLLWLALLGCFAWARRALRRVDAKAAADVQVGLIFNSPIAAATVLALLASGWIYPQWPRLFMAIVGAATLFPATILLRKLLDRRLFPVLDALVAFYFVDQLRLVAASQPLLTRLLSLLEMLSAVIFVGWLLRAARLAAAQASQSARFWKTLRAVACPALALFAVAFVANVVGCLRLSLLVGHATLTSAYFALVLYAVVRIVDGMLFTALSLPPLTRLVMVQRHRAALQAHATRLLGWVGCLLWAIFVLELLALRQPVFEDLKSVFAARLQIGKFELQVGDVLLFAVTVWAAFFLSRVLRFLLEEEVYPRVKLAPGLHYSVSTMSHYAVLLVGFFVALYWLGFDLTKLTILAGAFSVGLGFGLQNVVNNFVSGLILLFERPVKVGDLIQLDAAEGVVKRIGIRACIVRTASGSEIIVPNGKLISDPFTNWTLSDRERLIAIPISVAPETDPRRVMELLEGVAASHPLILKEPAPKAVTTSFGASALGFELRAWTDHAQDWQQIRSDLFLALNTALAAQKISLR